MNAKAANGMHIAAKSDNGTQRKFWQWHVVVMMENR